MKDSVAAELLLLGKRTSTWILLGVWVFIGVLFGYIFPYISYLDANNGFRSGPLADMLPGHLVAWQMTGFPFYGGSIVLVMGALALGSEYGWGTLKTVFTQGPGRLQILAAKLIALALVLVLFVVAGFIAGAISSEAIALQEGAASNWPGVGEFVRGLAAGWFILAVWTAFGLVLGVLTRGVALAIGIGILYALIIEGLLSVFADRISWLEPLAKVLLRASGYSLAAAVGGSAADARDNGPGAFSGPYVSGLQATLVLLLLLTAFILIAGFLLHRRDVA